jgi:DNA-binding PadR family transcriptional regulator|tara:strand:- start:734 stop:1027 length:294 start_codon:yes stop_codon:yes gene_type:complete
MLIVFWEEQVKESLKEKNFRVVRPTPSQKEWLTRGLAMKKKTLPLFDTAGQRFNLRTVQSCLNLGWVKPAMQDPTYSKLTVYKLTEKGEQALSNNRK